MTDNIPTLTDIIEPGDPDKEAVASDMDENRAAPIENRENLQEMLVAIVDRAVSEALPAIEEHLRERLLSTLHEQLGEEITRLALKASNGRAARGKKKSAGPVKEHNPSLYGF